MADSKADELADLFRVREVERIVFFEQCENYEELLFDFKTDKYRRRALLHMLQTGKSLDMNRVLESFNTKESRMYAGKELARYYKINSIYRKESSNNKTKNLEMENSELKTELSIVNNENWQLETELSIVKTKNNELKERVSELEEIVSYLTQQVNDNNPPPYTD